MSKSYLHVHVPTVPVFRRPHSAQTDEFRALPKLTDTHQPNHYIMITENMLDAFKQQVVQSHKVTLELNNVKYKERKKHSPKAQFPSVLGDNIRGMHRKCNTSLDIEDTLPHRPVRVFVDDITQCSSRSVTLQDAGVNGSYVGKGQHRGRSKHVEPAAQIQRSMDSEDEGTFPDTIIETVARANTTYIEHAQVLPEIRAAPCPFHTKRQETGGAVNIGIRSPRRQRHLQLTTHQANNASSQQTPREGKTINVRIPEQFPTKPPPVLPRNMSSKDYVMTWLIHGSDPQGSNHFPEIIPNPIKPRNSNHKSKSKSRLANASIVD